MRLKIPELGATLMTFLSLSGQQTVWQQTSP